MTANNKKPKAVDHVREGTVEVTIWPNEGEKGTYWKATIDNSYLASVTGPGPDGPRKEEWKKTESYSEDDCVAAAIAFLSAYRKMRKLRLEQAAQKKAQAQNTGTTA